MSPRRSRVKGCSGPLAARYIISFDLKHIPFTCHCYCQNTIHHIAEALCASEKFRAFRLLHDALFQGENSSMFVSLVELDNSLRAPACHNYYSLWHRLYQIRKITNCTARLGFNGYWQQAIKKKKRTEYTEYTRSAADGSSSS